MLDIQQKRKIRSIAYNKITLVILFLVVLLVAHSTWSVYVKKKTTEELKNVSMQSFQALEARNADLDDKIARINTQEGVEAEIRTKFNVVKDGESMVMVVENEQPAATTTVLKESFWQKIKDFFWR